MGVYLFLLGIAAAATILSEAIVGLDHCSRGRDKSTGARDFQIGWEHISESDCEERPPASFACCCAKMELYLVCSRATLNPGKGTWLIRSGKTSKDSREHVMKGGSRVESCWVQSRLNLAWGIFRAREHTLSSLVFSVTIRNSSLQGSMSVMQISAVTPK